MHEMTAIPTFMASTSQNSPRDGRQDRVPHHLADNVEQNGSRRVRSVRQLLAEPLSQDSSALVDPNIAQDHDDIASGEQNRHQPEHGTFFDHKTVSEMIFMKISGTFRLPFSQRLLIKRLLVVAHEFQHLVGYEADAHILISSPTTDPTQSSFLIVPLLSNIFFQALDGHHVYASSASQALSEAFLVSRRCIQLGNRRTTNEASLGSKISPPT